MVANVIDRRRAQIRSDDNIVFGRKGDSKSAGIRVSRALAEANGYKKPTIVKCKEMTFPMDIIAQFNGGRFCVQCSGCHGCR